MPSMLDHVADKSGAELVRLAKQYEFPLFVKQANLDQTMNPGNLPSHVYADPRPGHEQFACHTAASTWLSALYFTEKKAEFHPKDAERIQARIDHYADYWRIKAAVDAVRRRHADLNKDAESSLPDSMYAYVWAGEDGTKHRRLRLKTAAEVAAAAEWLEQYRDRITFTDRHTIARKVLEKASSYGANLGGRRDFVERQAGHGCGDPAEIVALIEGRARLVPPSQSVTKQAGDKEEVVTLRDRFFKMAEAVKNTPRKALQPGMLVKLAETLDMLDREQGFTQRYAQGLARPEDVIFKATFGKVAEDLATVVATTTGKVYEKQSFAKLSVSDVEGLFGTDFAGRVTTPLGDLDPEKMAEEVATLPRPDAELLDGLMSDNGVRPVLTKAASSREGFTREEQKAWAAAYASVE